MQIFNNYLDLPLKSLKLNIRKHQISNKQIIYGPPKSGKTSSAIEYANNLKIKYLYLDLLDLRFQTIQVEELKNFLFENKIQFLILDNFSKQFELLEIANIVITTKRFFHEDFNSTLLMPLDFEEYILFSHNNTSLTHLFNQYIKNGNIPNIHEITFKSTYIQKNLTSKFEQNLIRAFFSHTAKQISLYDIFKELKEVIKISKDRFYLVANELTESNIILPLEKFQKPNGAKKLYLYDFTLYNNFIEIDFGKTFENMIFLELFGRDKSITYTEKFNFYSHEKKIGYINIPFLNEDNFIDKADNIYSHAKSLKVDKVQFITISLEDRVMIESIEFEAVPFWLWATSLEE